MEPKNFLKRITWKNDQPATEKQLDYARSLMRGIHAEQPAFSTLNDDYRKLVWRVWNAANIPDDLTKIEATHMIDFLRRESGHKLPDRLEDEILYRIEAGPLRATPAVVFASVCNESAKILLEEIEKRYPETVKTALEVREERKKAQAAK